MRRTGPASEKPAYYTPICYYEAAEALFREAR